ncbi:peptidase C39 family protein [Bradyrhizobium sp. IC3069]|uniref:peptidase C39 family protein n=1 Tax=Bradyrhizobium sp. IC4059 TaxID=2793805 RepID=UPI002A03D5AE|nr:peptidase C39 family protein [Bradyrhizobium sp. IC4059]MCA1518376.1 peptidase C39 family protein [Bradyrhizobium sp. IC3069]
MSHDQLFLQSRASQGGEVEVMQILQERDLAEACQRGIPVHIGTYSPDDLSKWMAVGWYPIAMVSIEFEGKTITHWVVVTGADVNYVFFHDPLKDPAEEDAATRVDHESFASMTEFGADRERAVILAGLQSWRMLRFRCPGFMLALNFGLTRRAFLVPDVDVFLVAAKSQT